MGFFIILATMVFVNGVFCWSAGSELYNEMNVAKRGVLIFIAVLCVILTFGLVKKFYEKFGFVARPNDDVGAGMKWYGENE